MRRQVVVLDVEAPDDKTMTELLTAMPAEWRWSVLVEADVKVLAAGPVREVPDE